MNRMLLELNTEGPIDVGGNLAPMEYGLTPEEWKLMAVFEYQRLEFQRDHYERACYVAVPV